MLCFLMLLKTVLAAWMRLKYPHIAIGALASSAPILQFEDIVPTETFYNIVSNDFRVTCATVHLVCLFCFVCFVLLCCAMILTEYYLHLISRSAKVVAALTL